MNKLLIILLSVLLTLSFSLSIGCKKAEEPVVAPPAEEEAPAEEAPAPEGQ